MEVVMGDGVRRLLEHGASVFEIELGRYLVAASSVSLLLWLGSAWTLPRRIQDRVANWSDRRREFVNSLITVTIFGVTGIFIMLMIDAGVYHVHGTFPPLWLALLEFVGVVIAHDAYFY